MSVHFSPEAAQDLEEIWLYIARDQPENATRFVRRVQKFCLETLPVLVAAGKRRDELCPGLFSFPIDAYIVFYRRGDAAV